MDSLCIALSLLKYWWWRTVAVCDQFVFCPIPGRQPSAAQKAGWFGRSRGCSKQSTRPGFSSYLAPYARDVCLLLAMLNAVKALTRDGIPRCRLSVYVKVGLVAIFDSRPTPTWFLLSLVDTNIIIAYTT